jgi:CheY-like chemotaxis protein
MKHFSVLLVDDDRDNILDPAVKEFADNPRVRLRVAEKFDPALKLLKSEFFHLALIDARLHRTDGRNLDGLALLGEVKELRPSCERVLITENLYPEAEMITKELHPVNGCAQSLLNKADPVHSFSAVIANRADHWLSNQVEVVGAAAVVEVLRKRLERRRPKPGTSVTDDEIDFLVSRLFGQGQLWNQPEGVGIARVQLDLIKQGFSPAAVLKARCYSTTGSPGIWCVLKLAQREVVGQELLRYSRYVRYRLALHYRVELLGWELADNLGVLCYNFASGSPDDVASLSDLYLHGKEGFYLALDDLLSPGKQGWYAESVWIDSLAHYFQNAYGLDTVAVRQKIRQYLTELGRSVSVMMSPDHASVCGASFELPAPAVFSRNVFRRRTPGCIVHGDMHCDNILVGAGNRPNLIDYYSVQNGPRALDFATLEASVRLLDIKARGGDGASLRPDAEVIPELARLGEGEARVWKSVWAAGITSAAPPASEPWVKASLYIAEKAKANYRDLTEEEYAATCLMWAMRLFKVDALTSLERMRLFVWISSLVAVLKEN